MTDPTPGNGDAADEREPNRFGELRRFALHQLRMYDVPSAHLDADDVVQMTWLVLHRNQDRIRQPDRYMYTVARRLIQSAAETAGFWNVAG